MNFLNYAFCAATIASSPFSKTSLACFSISLASFSGISIFLLTSYSFWSAGSPYWASSAASAAS